MTKILTTFKRYVFQYYGAICNNIINLFLLLTSLPFFCAVQFVIIV